MSLWGEILILIWRATGRTIWCCSIPLATLMIYLPSCHFRSPWTLWYYFVCVMKPTLKSLYPMTIHVWQCILPLWPYEFMQCSWHRVTSFILGNSQSIAKIPTISATTSARPFHVTLWVFRRKLQARSGKHITATQPTANNILHKQVLTLWQPEIARLREAMCGSGPGLRGCQARAVLVPTLLIHNSKKKIMAIHRWNWVVPRWWRWRVQVVSLPMFGVSGCMPCVVSGNLWLVFLAEAMSQMTYIY